MNLLLLGLMFRDEEKRMQFLVRCALAFDVRFDTLCKLLNMDAKKLTEKLHKYDLEEKMFDIEVINYRTKEEAEAEFLHYYNELSTAFLNRDKEKVKGLMCYVDDSGIKIIKEKRQKSLPLTDDEILFLVKYQVMHRMNMIKLCEIIEYNRHSYLERVKKIEAKGKSPELFTRLNTFNELTYKKWLSSHGRQ